MTDHTVEIDLRGLRCPLPVLRLAKLTRGLPNGTIIRAEVTDPAALQDIPSYAAERGWIVLDIETDRKAILVSLKL